MGPKLFEHVWIVQGYPSHLFCRGVFCESLRVASRLIFSKYSFEDLLKMHGENIGITARLLRVEFVEWLEWVLSISFNEATGNGG